MFRVSRHTRIMSYARFGFAVATLVLLITPIAQVAQAGDVRGDFNGDGYTDLAIGNSSESFFDNKPDNDPDIVGAGSFHVMFGSKDSLISKGSQFFYQDTPGVPGKAEPNEGFGHRLAAADFNGDGFSDLAVSAPNDAAGKLASAGSVTVFYGTSLGLVTDTVQFFQQGSKGVMGIANLGDGFGLALGAGDFNGDGFADLAIGVPYDEVNGVSRAGAVNVLYGSSKGIAAKGNEIWHQDNSELEDSAETNDNFGSKLVTADFDGDGFDDLVVSVYGQSIDGLSRAGAVHFIRGGSKGLSGFRDRVFHQNTPGVKGVAEEGDWFGLSLAAGDFDANGLPDLAIGVRGESVGWIDQAGAVNVLYSMRGAGITTINDQIWHQNSAFVEDVAETGDRFGTSLAAADFDRDGYVDLAIGVPNELLLPPIGPLLPAEGAVALVLGGPGGLSATGNRLIPHLGSASGTDFFGGSLAVGDFNADKYPDLAIGSFAPVGDPGAVVILTSDNAGLDESSAVEWTQNDPNLYEMAQPVWDVFGVGLSSQ